MFHAADRADLAMLLLASGDVRRDRSASDHEDMADQADWLCHAADEKPDVEMAVAAAFEREMNWRRPL